MTERRKKKAVGSKLIVLNTKLTREERALFRAKARKYAKGNVSAWLRHAGCLHTPRKGERVSLKPGK